MTTTSDVREVETGDAFADRLVGLLNGGALTLMISIGHRTRLFDTLRRVGPATSAALAEAAGLNERYVREWLGAMVTGDVVRLDPALGTYSLPAHRAASLTRAAAADNIATLAQYIGLLGTVEDRVVECFRDGGGVGYEEFGRFHEVMAEDSGQSVLPALLDRILPLAPGVLDALQRGIDVLDVGCGVGRALARLASHFPNSRFVGYDLCQEAVDRANAEHATLIGGNLRFEVHDVSDLPADGFDLVTAFDAIHDQAAPQRVLDGIRAALRPGGTFLMQDIDASSDLARNTDHPIGPLLYTISTMHCMTVSLAQGGEGLGTVWGRETALRMLAAAGFENVAVHTLPHDFQNCFYVARR